MEHMQDLLCGHPDQLARAALADVTRVGAVEVVRELFLAEKIYGGPCRHELIRIDYSNRFSDRV